jgi:FkbM family methyltransferase
MNKLSELNLEFRTSDYYGGEWLWPADEFIAWRYLHKSAKELPKKISSICKNKGVVLQAGGNAGLYPKEYSKIFDIVITIEPDNRNFFCLTHNVEETNVFKIQACLGNSNEFLDLVYNEKYKETNRGGMKVSGLGKIPQITIDSLNLNPDLIHLDIEGYEGFAIEGAKETLTKYSPIVVLETNGSGDQYGWPQEKIDNLLKSYGYTILETWGHDTVYGK